MPNDAYSLEVDTGTLTRWTDRTRQPTTGERFAEPELVRMKSFDGVSISALVIPVTSGSGCPHAIRFVKRGQRPFAATVHLPVGCSSAL